jgi:exosortase/archaeosortase family protein
MLYSAFVLAFPAKIKAKLTGIIWGIPFLSVANVVRIALVTAIGAWRPSLFEYAHVYLMQVIMVMLVCVTCLIWLRWATAIPTTRNLLFEFLIRFLAIASIQFVLWLPIHREYVALLDQFVIYLFSLIDFKLFIPPRPEIYHHTLSLIVFSSLICASSNIGVRRKAYGLVTGLFVLVLIHLLIRIAHVLVTAIHIESVIPIFLTILVVNQYLLPVLLWLTVVQQRKNSQSKTTCACPLCGAEKVGMLHHISAVHGKKALDDPRVQLLL